MTVLFAVAYVLLLVLSVIQCIRWRTAARADGAFRCRIRLSAGHCARWPRLRHRWSRRRLRACWVDGDLVVWHRPVLPRSVRLPARVGPDGVCRLTVVDVSRLGDRPVAVELDLSDGSRIEVVTTESARLELVGPYLTAALTDLPPAPRPRRQIRGPGW